MLGFDYFNVMQCIDLYFYNFFRTGLLLLMDMLLITVQESATFHSMHT